MDPTIKRYAEHGARLRAAEIQAELAAIYSAFPTLAPLTRGGEQRMRSARAAARATSHDAPARKRKPMTPAQKLAVGRRMKKYWAARRKAAQ